jgi:hypothetical protein
MNPQKYIAKLEKEKNLNKIAEIAEKMKKDKAMNPLIQFIPKNEAMFSCPQSALDKFTHFLKQEHIQIIGTEEAGDSHGEPYFHIEVLDVDLPESEQLISKFNRSLRES